MSGTQSKALLSMRGVKAYYGAVNALKGVDLEIDEGEIVTMIGANGAGKTTLMMTIFGNPRAREGAIHFCGRDITRMPTHQIARLGLAQSPEGRRIFPRMSVMENLQMGAKLSAIAASRRISTGSFRFFRGSRSARASAAAPCREANSRCWRSRAP